MLMEVPFRRNGVTETNGVDFILHKVCHRVVDENVSRQLVCLTATWFSVIMNYRNA
jgi:hypothetical protein